ncbi:MAG: hypothetical protein IJN67_08905 [Oscillospiraceae bacterium]|nr:hypothetical protein [Oscillospiraceae bacterium]
MENENLTPEAPELDSWQREERCRRALKTVSKAMFMRLFVTALLIWAAFQTSMELWILGLIALVLVINLAGLLPLWTEWKKQRMILKAIIAEDEA